MVLVNFEKSKNTKQTFFTLFRAIRGLFFRKHDTKWKIRFRTQDRIPGSEKKTFPNGMCNFNLTHQDSSKIFQTLFWQFFTQFTQLFESKSVFWWIIFHDRLKDSCSSGWLRAGFDYFSEQKNTASEFRKILNRLVFHENCSKKRGYLHIIRLKSLVSRHLLWLLKQL